MTRIITGSVELGGQKYHYGLDDKAAQTFHDYDMPLVETIIEQIDFMTDLVFILLSAGARITGKKAPSRDLILSDLSTDDLNEIVKKSCKHLINVDSN